MRSLYKNGKTTLLFCNTSGGVYSSRNVKVIPNRKSPRRNLKTFRDRPEK